MARKRMIDPAIWDSEQVMSLSPRQFKIFIYLISQADDEGRLKISYPLFLSRIFPINKHTSEELISDIKHLAEIELIQIYSNGKYQYICHPNWKEYQYIQKPRLSKLPAPSDSGSVPCDYGTPTISVQPNRIEKNRKEKNTITPPAAETAEKAQSVSSFSEDKELYNSTKEAFESKYGRFENYGKEGKAIKGLIKKATDLGLEPDIVLPQMIAKFYKLTQNGDKFWRSQPFLPSALNASGIWVRVKVQAEGKSRESPATDKYLRERGYDA